MIKKNHQKKNSFIVFFSIIFLSTGFLIPLIISLFWKPDRNKLGIETFQLHTTIIVLISTIFIFIILIRVFKLRKNEIKILLISGIFVILWEIFVETFLGWKLGLWYFMPDETNILKVFLGAFRVGIDFYGGTLIIGTIGIYLVRKFPNQSRIFIINLLIFIIALGYSSDIFVGLMNTYLITLIVWIVLSLGYFCTLYFVYKLILKQNLFRIISELKFSEVE